MPRMDLQVLSACRGLCFSDAEVAVCVCVCVCGLEFEMPVSDEHSDIPIAPMDSVPRSASCGLDELSAT
jgi:hypothetical protein